MSMEQIDDPLFTKVDTTLKDIAAAGWRVKASSSGEWWYERWKDGAPGPVDRIRLPQWVRELIANASKRGAQKVQADVRRALGLRVTEQKQPETPDDD